ncbi:MAG: hypothetical protein E6R05_00355 [Candidatus Moraniibacteriota bacterium]|nr:MAG: hypothetical protein E6R05_00355 [Candidatus Moranbacteria bacterium]
MKRNSISLPAVVFFVFKRPKTTYDFLKRMVDAGAEKIYVFADGPRNAEEKLLTDDVQSEIRRFVRDYPTINIVTQYALKNQGLRNNIISGLNYVFKNEMKAIIIEDDCLVSRDFFRFTSEMLDRYVIDDRVMSINGMSVGGDYDDYSYGFTKYPQCWGWATWKRAWKLYDPMMRTHEQKAWYRLASQLGMGIILRNYFELMFKLIRLGQINTWDFQWAYAHFVNRGLAISPHYNLVSNIGFDAAATNTKARSRVANLKTTPLEASLHHPPVVSENISVSRAIERKFYANPIAILGLLRQYFYYQIGVYAHRS